MENRSVRKEIIIDMGWILSYYRPRDFIHVFYDNGLNIKGISKQ